MELNKVLGQTTPNKTDNCRNWHILAEWQKADAGSTARAFKLPGLWRHPPVTSRPSIGQITHVVQNVVTLRAFPWRLDAARVPEGELFPHWSHVRECSASGLFCEKFLSVFEEVKDFSPLMKWWGSLCVSSISFSSWCSSLSSIRPKVNTLNC